ncbi:MAG: hypothetical protein CK425_11320 [Parachlamydia sp.]|nr:MAG: hypothetical protein CK425_11320 [Parachlamydia sp.]
MTDYLHNHNNFNDLILILSNDLSISPVLIVKDYWIMHCLYGLQNQGLNFQMKGGTSLSKGYNLIHRFSEDIDILIEPPKEMSVHVRQNQNKDVHKDSRRLFYDWLAQSIKIDGIVKIERDTAFDDDKYRSGGIRLYYKTVHNHPKDIKEGVLLEVGFDDVTPNFPKTVSSWAYNYAEKKVNIRDNRAKNVLCYHPGYTLVEKLQTISTKFRKQQAQGTFSENFMRHYYDVYCLLKNPEIQEFILTEEYKDHKKKRFRKGDNPIILENEAFFLREKEIRLKYQHEYELSQSLYYKEKPTFQEILQMIEKFADKL